MSFKTLDVGCGNSPRGDVNCDLYVNATKHRGPSGIALHVKNIANFVKCDATNLPFKKGSFDVVIASHILEHLDSPLDALKEWKTVTRKKVVVAIPDLNVQRLFEEDVGHIFTWSSWSIKNLMEKVFPRVEVYCNTRFLSWQKQGRLPGIFNFVLKRFLSAYLFFRTLS